MTEVKDYYPELDKLEIFQLHARRDALLTGAEFYVDEIPASVGDYNKLKDEPLAELLAISRALRKKAAVGTKRKASKAKEPASLDSLA